MAPTATIWTIWATTRSSTEKTQKDTRTSSELMPICLGSLLIAYLPGLRNRSPPISTSLIGGVGGSFFSSCGDTATSVSATVHLPLVLAVSVSFFPFFASLDVYSSDSKKVMRDKHDVLHVSFVLEKWARVRSNSNREVIVYGRVAVG